MGTEKRARTSRNWLNISWILCLMVCILLTGCAQTPEVKPLPKKMPHTTSKTELLATSLPTIGLERVKAAKIPIFMYHAVSEKVYDARYSDNFYKPSRMEEDIKYLKDNHYDAIFVSDFGNIGSYQKPIALTFDDGYKNFYNTVFPLLKKYKIKATLYAIVGKTGEYGRCGWDDLREMEASGFVSVESHSMNHLDMSTLSNTVAEAELTQSKRFLQEILNKKVTSFCYPVGGYNSMTPELAAKYYEFALDKNGGVYDMLEHDRYLIPRVRMSRDYKLSFFIDTCKESGVVLK
ncbi:MAG: polysaccharide deacetylase family protein [Clostridia bacterium]